MIVESVGVVIVHVLTAQVSQMAIKHMMIVATVMVMIILVLTAYFQMVPVDVLEHSILMHIL